MSRNYKNVVAWQRGHELTLSIYRLSKLFPREEIYGITSQVRRSAFSVPANIAEGSGRDINKDYLRFLYIALASLKETEMRSECVGQLHRYNVRLHRNHSRKAGIHRYLAPDRTNPLSYRPKDV